MEDSIGIAPITNLEEGLYEIISKVPRLQLSPIRDTIDEWNTWIWTNSLCDDSGTTLVVGRFEGHRRIIGRAVLLKNQIHPDIAIQGVTIEKFDEIMVFYDLSN